MAWHARARARASTVDSTPSSSNMYSPVMSPSSLLASKMEGLANVKVAVPLEPSRERVSRTSASGAGAAGAALRQ